MQLENFHANINLFYLYTDRPISFPIFISEESTSVIVHLHILMKYNSACPFETL